jgi:hypothetical protein
MDLGLGLTRSFRDARPSATGAAPPRAAGRPQTLDPVVLISLLGLVAGLAKSDLRLPPAIYDFVSTILLLAYAILRYAGRSGRSDAAAAALMARASPIGRCRATFA